ncbi:MAG: DNA-binding IclR family transcriptional regulator [Cryomorphaceae bacterium]|jgi:DNA-binding IclR family transcriptional regulator
MKDERCRAGVIKRVKPILDNQSSEKSSAALRVLAILETVATSSSPMTATEINQVLKLPKPTIHRLCMMLETQGYLQPRLDGRGYLPGKRLSSMALGIFSNNDHWRTERHGILQRLSEKIGETCNISIPDGSQMIYFDRVETHWPLRIQLQKNDRVPTYCTASGKLFLNHLPSSKRTRLLSKMNYQQFTPNTMTNLETLKAELKRLREQDIGVDNEEFMHGMVAVAVPLKNDDGQFFGALAMHAPSARVSMEKALQQIPTLRTAAAELIELINE